MQAITKYKSDRGREYATAEKAEAADKLFAMQQEVSRLLPQAVDETCRYANGHGYVQHTQEDVDAFVAGITRLIRYEFGDESECLKAWMEGYRYAGRYLDDSGSNTYRLWSRWACIDSQLREWGQGFYKLNPHEGEQVQWQPVARLGMRHFD